jgi:hypothetical protein
MKPMSMERKKHNMILLMEAKEEKRKGQFFFCFFFGGVCHKNVLNNLVRAVRKICFLLIFSYKFVDLYALFMSTRLRN